MTNPFRLSLLAAITALPVAGSAQGSADADALANRLRSLYPGKRIDAVQPSPVPGLFEVVMGGNLAYVEPGGRYFVFGNVWDMRAQRDLTAERRASVDRIDTSALAGASAIRSVNGTGRRLLYVFADPECGYCKQLEKTLATLRDATIVTIPVALLSPVSAAKASTVLCAADPSSAWRHMMVEGGDAQLSDRSGDRCMSAVEANTELARRVRVRGTPLMVAADGRRLPGARPVAEIAAWLDNATAAAGTDGGALR